MEIKQHCENGAELNHDEKHVFEFRFELDELVHDDHVSGAADRQKFRNSLNDS